MKQLVELFYDSPEKKTINGLDPRRILNNALKVSSGQKPEVVAPSEVWDAFYTPAEGATYVPIDSNPFNFWVDNIYPVDPKLMKEGFNPSLLTWENEISLNGFPLTVMQYNPFENTIVYTSEEKHMSVVADEDIPAGINMQTIVKAWQVLSRKWNKKGLLEICWKTPTVSLRLSAESYSMMAISAIRTSTSSNIIVPESNIIKLR